MRVPSNSDEANPAQRKRPSRRRTVQRERLNLKWFLRSFCLLKEYYHIVLNKIVVQAAAGRAGVCLRSDVSQLGDAFNHFTASLSAV